MLVASAIGLKAQETLRLRLARQDAEALFLQNNLLLISEKLHIERQKAVVIQAKLWPNPEFSLNEINLWKNSTVEPTPPIFGNIGQNQQIAFEINQLILTAGKRKKLIALEQVDVSKAEQYFEELLRGLKLELRNNLTELLYVQQLVKVYENLTQNISKLTSAYANQLDKGYISKSEYIRLKAEELKINKEILELNHQSNEIQKELKLLFRLDPNTTLEIINEDVGTNVKSDPPILLEQMLERAKESRPDYKYALLEEEYSHKLLVYEKAQRVPDLKFGMNYDRNGSTMLNFVGVGVSMDLPFFSRNQGGIKKAQICIENAKIQKKQTLLSIENEVFLTYKSLQQALDFLRHVDTNYEVELDDILEKQTKNFTSRNVSMLEYFDFMHAYLNNKKIILEARRDVEHKAEKLNYSIGRDL